MKIKWLIVIQYGDDYDNNQKYMDFEYNSIENNSSEVDIDTEYELDNWHRKKYGF